jgi:hypothetical protein
VRFTSRPLVAVVLALVCNTVDAGNWFGRGFICELGRPPHPSDIAGIYVHRGEGHSVTLTIRTDGSASLSWPPLGVGGFIFMGGWHDSEDLRLDEFVFQGAAYPDGSPVTKKFKRGWDESTQDSFVLDISDPATPLKFVAEEPFPWTLSFVLGAFVAGGLVGRHFATRPIKPKAATRKGGPS